MLSEDRYFQTLSEEDLWQRYCGFLHLTLDEFMGIQNRLLLDEIEQVSKSTLGKHILGDNIPKSVDEFRRMVPITTYDTYKPFLKDQLDSALATKPYAWCHSAGRQGSFKWIPQNAEAFEKCTRNFIGSWILSSASRRGEVKIGPGIHIFAMMPPPPYTSGWVYKVIRERFTFEAIPNPEAIKNLDMQDRIQLGVQVALRDGVDIACSLGSVLANIGEKFESQGQKRKLTIEIFHPKVISRLILGLIRSRQAKRRMQLKDLWAPKGIVCGGVDTNIYKADIARYWGVEPLDFYVCTEAIFMAMQSWNKKAMTFIPDSAFLEFIPYDEHIKNMANPDYKPRTVLLDGLEAGKLYEVLITQFYGLPFLRYRMNDIIKVVSLRDEETGVNLPQIIVQRRVGESINIGALTDLDEKTIWQAIFNTGVECVDWTARKEYDHNQSFLRVYLEQKKNRDPEEVAKLIDEQLRIIDIDYKDIGDYLKLQPVRVTPLSRGTFDRHTAEKRKAGADPAHLKPNHINPSEETLHLLLKLSNDGDKE